MEACFELEELRYHLSEAWFLVLFHVTPLRILDTRLPRGTFQPRLVDSQDKGDTVIAPWE